MILSSDGTILERVVDADLNDGACVVPPGVVEICEGAFEDCNRLTNITLPAGLTSIGRYAFSKCSHLAHITLPESLVSIGPWAFFGCSGLTSITLPEGVKSIMNFTFSGCSALTDVTLPMGLDYIGQEAFRRCHNLTSITLPEGPINIEIGAFSYCSHLSHITLPEGVEKIEQSAFENCSALNTIMVNTSSSEEIIRIQNMLPVALRDNVIANPVYDDVMICQQQAYQNVTSSPMLSHLRYASAGFLVKHLPFDVLTSVARFESDVSQNHFTQAMQKLELPTTQEALVEYKAQVHDVVRASNARIKAQDEPRFPYIAKLQRYIAKLEEQRERKNTRDANFFKHNPETARDVIEKINVSSKLVEWLKGDDSLTFSQQESMLLHHGVLGQIFSDLSASIDLPDLPLALELPSASEVSGPGY
jgi:hypothetical protein